MKLSVLRKIWMDAREQEAKAKEYNRLVGGKLNYPILQDIANVVSANAITIRVGPLADGTYITMESKPQPTRRSELDERLRLGTELMNRLGANIG